MSKLRVQKGNIDRGDAARALLTDTGPADVPIVVSNDGFHANLRRAGQSSLFAKVNDALVLKNRERYTVPYRYRIRLSATSSRTLSLVHPSAQFKVCSFYRDYAHLIPHFCRHSEASLRRPVKIGSSIFFLSGRSNQKKYKGAAIDILMQDRTMRNPGSYFAYAGHDRFHRFFASDDFLKLEKTYSVMRVTDVSKCFTSIYTHTMAWAVKDIEHGKENVAAVSFANDFDHLMQYSNYNETNGIPVGSEVSRIFAEIILQSVDAEVLRAASKLDCRIGIDFTYHRYVDDYVIFAHDEKTLDQIQLFISAALSRYNLYLNDHKTYTVHRPLQTRKSHVIAEATIGLNAFRKRLTDRSPHENACLPMRIRNPSALVRTLVNDIKMACKNAGMGYGEISAFVIGALAHTIEDLIESFPQSALEGDDVRVKYIGVFEALLSAIFFYFTVHITVPTSYAVAKSVILSLRFFNTNIPDATARMNEVVRRLIEDLVRDPELHDIIVDGFVPVELMNIVLASSELPRDYRIDVRELNAAVLGQERVDYFSIVSLLFYNESSDPEFIRSAEETLQEKFLPDANPSRASHDAHLMLDLIACPHLTVGFRMKVLNRLFVDLCLPSGSRQSRLELMSEIESAPWFVNWRQIDLLNHLRKKELSTAY
ncbi:MAG: RNA-directed DNA polymerase [Alphaproteobacteria bacterium]|nr:RNA-directed DNA polymerase [Alphaproteobacteria bacterium]MBU0804395.1 RNA-directed DNA polymerase [Alphaproteobacteria bacterium]MBU0871226.1 RNA-directed DNA polymerase [Alphaproteobacteria bacterium]MBU1400981.1 RNA-directed DNA polymerase [Alphaproteobacteria bacterium]MBU1592602.1 RNA-directed DNA polymerase [Alphaproteobacteria bacterium]